MRSKQGWMAKLLRGQSPTQLCRYLTPLVVLPRSHIHSKLHFALCDATHWMSHYNGFNYEEFYEFVIDFFEGDQTPEGIAASRELYNWWNKYVPNQMLIFTAADTSPERCFQDPLLLEQPRQPQHGSRRLRC